MKRNQNGNNMNIQDTTAPKSEQESKDKPPHPRHQVAVTIDGRIVMMEANQYLVTDLKSKLGVPPEYELEHIEHGQFQPLADEALFSLHHAEEFISHVRTGTSS